MGRRIEALQLRVHRVCGVHSLGHCNQQCSDGFDPIGGAAGRETHYRGRRAGADRDGISQIAGVSRAGVFGNGLPVRSAWTARAVVAGGMTMTTLPWDLQVLNTLAALLLLLSFAMLSQRRIVALVDLLALQGALLCVATLLLAWRTGDRNLYLSAGLTLGLKVIFLPWLLHPLLRPL